MYCSMCGKEIQENILFCNWCGNRVEVQNNNSDKDKDFVIRGGVLEKYIGQSTTVVIPSGVRVIGENSFRNCYGITKVVVPDGVTSIKWGAFQNCEKLQSIVLPNTLVEIQQDAFSNCKSLENMVIPGSLKRLEGVIFDGCSSLKKVEFQKGITYIAGMYKQSSDDYFPTIRSIFGRGSNVEMIVLPETLEVIGTAAFYGCNLKEIVVPESVIMIGAWAFSYCNKIELKIPSSIKIIGVEAFSNCAKINNIVLPKTVLIDHSPSCNDVLDGKIPNVMVLGYGAFKSCSGLDNVVIPLNITNNIPANWVVSSYIIDMCFKGTPIDIRKNNKRCLYCGGKFKGIVTKVCSICGKAKNY